MNVRRGLMSLFALAFVASGCASGGGGTGAVPGALSQPIFDDDNLPDWVLALPEGEPPRDTDDTGVASLYLLQAQSQSGERAEALYRQALDAARAGIAADPENAQPYFQAGQAYLGLGDLAQAGAMLDRAEAIYPRYVVETDYVREVAWIDAFNEGVTLLIDGTGDPQPHFERAHAIYKGRPEAMVQLGALHAERGRPGDAIGYYLEAIALIEGPRAQRIEDQDVVAEWAEAREVALFNSGQLLFQEERFPEAVQVFEKLTELFPDDLAVLNNLAASLVSAGQSDRATALYDDLMQRPGLTARDFFMIGVGLSQGGQEIPAARAFAEAHRRIPQDREALYNYAQSLYFGDAWEELAEVGPRLLEVDTHNRNAYQIAATPLVQLGREQEASAILSRFEALPFDLSGMYMGPLPDGVAVVGRITNRAATAGSAVRLRMHFYDLNGGNAGTEDISVTLGAVDEPVNFQVDRITNQDVAGYRYEVLN